jgi:hypothetical protein
VQVKARERERNQPGYEQRRDDQTRPRQKAPRARPWRILWCVHRAGSIRATGGPGGLAARLSRGHLRAPCWACDRSLRGAAWSQNLATKTSPASRLRTSLVDADPREALLAAGIRTMGLTWVSARGRKRPRQRGRRHWGALGGPLAIGPPEPGGRAFWARPDPEGEREPRPQPPARDRAREHGQICDEGAERSESSHTVLKQLRAEENR